MPILDDTQTERALRAMQAYLSAARDLSTGQTSVEAAAELDQNRCALIDRRLTPLVTNFLAGSLPVGEFKTEIDRINKQNELWGFKGIKGQMFFNLIYNNCVDEGELTAELQAAITLPDTDDLAKSRIRNFASYVRRIGESRIEMGGSKHGCPKISSIPFFLSYFWQIQAPERWPVYFTTSVQALSDLNLYQPADDLADAYIDYVHLHLELQKVFSDAAGRRFSLYDVEHVWWDAKHQKPVGAPTTKDMVGQTLPATGKLADAEALPIQLPDSYVPPIIDIIPRLAANDPRLETAARASGTSIPRALEKSIHAAFTILGYETQLLGQGQGRVQDGLAVSQDYSYAILWDAKARENGYRMGTDDRTIREYITTQSRELKKRRHLRNLYYVIISSSFQDDFDDLIRGLKMDTEVSEVCLVQGEALVAMIDAKLRDPNQLTLGPDGLQRLFCQGGLISEEDVRQELS